MQIKLIVLLICSWGIAFLTAWESLSHPAPAYMRLGFLDANLLSAFVFYAAGWLAIAFDREIRSLDRQLMALSKEKCPRRPENRAAE